MTALQEKLFELSDREYAAFQSKLTPTVEPDRFIGVRVPKLRELAREFSKSPECDAFLASLPHEYYDENLLHSVLLEKIKDYARCVELVEGFLPYVDNWAVCDTIQPKVFSKHRDELLPKIKKWIASGETYTCRFGIDMLMTYYLDDAFTPEQPELVAEVRSGEYYVKMMAAWYFATALAKQWDAAIPYIENRRLDAWTHNKAIQKAIESYRITPEQKEYLRSLRINRKE